MTLEANRVKIPNFGYVDVLDRGILLLGAYNLLPKPTRVPASREVTPCLPSSISVLGAVECEDYDNIHQGIDAQEEIPLLKQKDCKAVTEIKSGYAVEYNEHDVEAENDSATKTPDDGITEAKKKSKIGASDIFEIVGSFLGAFFTIFDVGSDIWLASEYYKAYQFYMEMVNASRTDHLFTSLKLLDEHLNITSTYIDNIKITL